VSLKKSFSRKATSGRITDGKEFAANAIQWEKFSEICFHV
jgi:hypothetical protein